MSLTYSSSVLMGALRAASAVGAPDRPIGGSAIRERVWNHLHGIPSRPVKDVEPFFDTTRLAASRKGYTGKGECRRASSDRDKLSPWHEPTAKLLITSLTTIGLP